MCYSFVFRNVIKGYGLARDEPGSNEKTMGGGGQYSNPFTFRFRSRGSPRIHVLLRYFFPPFNYYRKSCVKPSLQLHLLFSLSEFIFISFTSSICEKTFRNWILTMSWSCFCGYCCLIVGVLIYRLGLRHAHTRLLSQIELRAVPKDKMFPVSCTPCRKKDFPSHFLNVFLTMKEIVLGKIFLV